MVAILALFLNNMDNIYRLAFSKSHDIIILADCDRLIIEVNPAAVKNLGYSEDEFLNMDLAQLFFDKKEADKLLEDMCVKDLVVHQEFSFVDKDGKSFPALVNADQIDDENGTFMVVAQNISVFKQQKEAEQDKKEMIVIGTMSQKIAHEIKNPLNNVLLGLNQLRASQVNLNEDGEFYIDFLERNGLRINELLDKLINPLNLFNMKREKVQLNELVNEAVKYTWEKFKKLNIAVKMDLSAHPIHRDLDPKKMIIAINNILVNSMEAINEDGVIYIRTEYKDGKASLVISDNGHGIPRENMKKIFQPYFTTKPKGMGLGLANTEQILNAHNIEMDIQSEVGKGSTFTLYF